MNKLHTVMCVDDDSDILAVTRLSLETVAGLKVHGCSSGADMLATVGTVKPDLILLDVMMPQMDGPTTLRVLRQNPTTHAIPVVFLTARIQPSDTEHYLKMGATGVIAKPFDPMTLAGQIGAIYDQHMAGRPA